jgi:hypothetical protein
MALSWRKKKPAVQAGNRSTAPGAEAPLRPSRYLVGKRKANELASSGGSPEPLPAIMSAVTGEKLPRATGNSVRPRVGRRTRLS